MRKAVSQHSRAFLVIGALLLTLGVFGAFTAAITFTTSDTEGSILLPNTVRSFTIAVDNTDVTAITDVVITLPTGFTYRTGTNATTASGADFSTSSQNLSWSHGTSLVAAAASQNFTFKSRVSNSTGEIAFTVTVSNSTEINSTTVTFDLNGDTTIAGNFSIGPGTMLFNESSQNLTLTSNANTTQLIIRRNSTVILPSFFSTSEYSTDEYTGFTSSKRTLCIVNDMDLSTVNLTSLTLNQTQTTDLAEEQSAVFSVSAFQFCPPGRYEGNFTVTQLNDTAEIAQSNVIIDIFVSAENTLDHSTRSGFVKGSTVTSTAHTYHFYTNTSIGTWVTLRLNDLDSNDMDLFLFDRSTLLAKSILTGTSSEALTMKLPDTRTLWNFKVGNVTEDYIVNMYFAPLNITNRTQAIGVNSIDFGQLLPAQNSTNTHIVLVNNDDQNATSVNETIDLFYVSRVHNKAVISDYEFLVPSFAESVKVRLTWEQDPGENLTDWDLSLFDHNGGARGTSTTKWLNANASGALREEFIHFTGPFNSSIEGVWNVSVVNATAVDTSFNNYNITVLVKLDESSWVNSNFSTGSTVLTSSGSEVILNVTPPGTNILNGSYEGVIKYANGSTGTWEIELPFSFQMLAGTLLVDNNLSSTPSYEIQENIGFNLTRQLSIVINNTGGSPVDHAITTSNDTLYGPSGKNISFGITTTLSDPLAANTQETMVITYYINDTTTTNTEGVYQGWLLLNTTSSVQNASYPHKTINITLRVNLTSNLNVTTRSFSPGTVIPGPNTTNTTAISVQVRLQNGTAISTASYRMGLTNFSSVVLMETNITSYTKTLSNIQLGQGSICDDPVTGECVINATLPSDTVGGRYLAKVNVEWADTELTRDVELSGISNNSDVTLIVDGAGYAAQGLNGTSLGTIDEASTTEYWATIKNFGPSGLGSVNVTFDKGSCSLSSVDASAVDCTEGSLSSSPGASFIITGMPGFAATGCTLKWILTTSNVSSDDSCSDAQLLVDNTTLVRTSGISLTVNNADSGSTSNSSSSSGGGAGGSNNSCSSNTECGSSYHCSSSTCKLLECTRAQYIENHACKKYQLDVTYENEIDVILGNEVSTDVKVEEKDKKSITMSLQSTINDGVEFSVNKDKCTPGDDPCVFTVTYKTTDETKIGEHKGDYKFVTTLGEVEIDTKPVTVTVLPTESKKQEIRVTFDNKKLQFANLTTIFERLKLNGIVPAANLSKVELLLNETNELIKKIQDAIAADDFITAQTHLDELDDKFKQIESRLSQSLSEEQTIQQQFFSFDLWIWILTGIIIVGVAGFFVYLLLPPKEDYPSLSRGSSKKQEQGVKGANPLTAVSSKLGGLFKRGGEKTKQSPSRYSRQSSSSQHYSFGKEKEKVSGFFNMLHRKPTKEEIQHDIKHYTKTDNKKKKRKGEVGYFVKV